MEVRRARADDYDAYARLFRELHIDDPIASSTRFAEDLSRRMIVVVDGENVVGYALYEALQDTGYIRNVVSDAGRRRCGIGLALMEALRDRFANAGATTWCLNVKPDNTAAVGLYERCGLRIAYRSSFVRLASETEVPQPPPELRMLDIPAHDDAAVEAAFGLLAGQLASTRAKGGGRRVLQLARGADVVGVAAFAPSIPGGFPFKLRSAGDGPAFAAYLRELAPPAAAYIQLGIEDDEPLCDALIAAGARLHLELAHMRGPIGRRLVR